MAPQRHAAAAVATPPPPPPRRRANRRPDAATPPLTNENENDRTNESEMNTSTKDVLSESSVKPEWKS
ncbi:hypothetical protein [Oryza sativa Japonica Group]|uniref:Uncharacterized protein n=1 Tax=Oryza sativa subsp. japonica TaxID=39947 RepID=Q5VNL4_ORYSJ|nr:hypothetical protein [Oryza sativa Japonica Group]